MWDAFKTLNAADQRRVLDSGQRQLDFTNSSLRSGAKVQFKIKGGMFIPGTFIRMKRKNAEVLSLYNRYGMKGQYPGRWNVSPALLIPLTTEQVKLHEFP